MVGLGVCQGIGIGNAFIIEKSVLQVKLVRGEDSSIEIKRFLEALDKSKEQILKLYNKTVADIGEKEAQIFKSHEMMLEDESFISEVENKIKNDKVNAEYALNETAGIYIKMFESIKDEYLKERAHDVRDVINRVLKNLLGIKETDFTKMKENSILIAKELTPSDTAQLDHKKVAAMITELGGRTSHAAIIAKNMGIPTVVGLEGILNAVDRDDKVICDGKTGKVIINPTEKQLNYYLKKKCIEEKANKELKKQIGLPTITRDGFKVELSSNIGTPQDVAMTLANDAEGIGLFRSEFIFMNRQFQPTEDEQFEKYKEVLSKMGSKPVIIRTLDIGGDKEVPYMDIPSEMNPFLGYRAIRLCLGNTEIFKTQLRAILRASVYGNAKIMFPMIATLTEIKEAKEVLEEAKTELRNKKIPFKNDIQVGIMVEIPSAAIISDILAKEVDFFSIGTNDLIQYTLAADRMNSKLSHLYSQYHPSLLRLIYNVIKNGHEAGIWVGMCGEASGDPILIPVLLGMGLNEFSMNAPSILKTRHIIRSINKKDMEKVAEKTLNMDSASHVEEYLTGLFSNFENDNYLSVNIRKRKK